MSYCYTVLFILILFSSLENMGDEIARGFLLLCAKSLEDKAGALATTIRTTNGKIEIKTMEGVQEAKGKNFGEKLGKVLNDYAHAVIVVCSQSFSDFIDKKSKTDCPDIIATNHGNLLESFEGVFQDRKLDVCLTRLF